MGADPPMNRRCKKIRYPDARSARHALRRARIAGVTGSTHRLERRTYWCPICSGWHLTSSAPDPGQPLLAGEVDAATGHGIPAGERHLWV